MSTERQRIQIGGITVEVVRKGIKHLHVGVYPPEGRVRVAAPRHLHNDAVRLAVVSRLAWVRRQQRRFLDQRRQSEREFVTGETIYYQGKAYRLGVESIGAVPRIRLCGRSRILLRVPAGWDRDQRDGALQRWYRRQLRALLPALIEKWAPRIGKPMPEIRIRRMKTRWGSCSADRKRIWLNLELITKPQECLEYVLVHEMVHLHERHHTERFQEWMDELVPSWRVRRDRLNAAPLAHEDWPY